jgi:hypothetical protein
VVIEGQDLKPLNLDDFCYTDDDADIIAAARPLEKSEKTGEDYWNYNTNPLEPLIDSNEGPKSPSKEESTREFIKKIKQKQTPA